MNEIDKSKMTPEEVKKLNSQKRLDKIHQETSKDSEADLLRRILIELKDLNKKIK